MKIVTEKGYFKIQLDSQFINFWSTGGYYTTLIRQGLRVMGLNTNLLYSQDKLTNSAVDPANMLQWMTETLTNARQNKEKVRTASVWGIDQTALV